MDMIKQNMPDLATEIEQLEPILRAYNLLMEAKEIGLVVNATELDVETVRLVYLLKTKIRERDDAKAPSKQGAMGRG